MRRHRVLVAWLGLGMGVLWASGAAAQTTRGEVRAAGMSDARATYRALAAQVPVEDVPIKVRERVRLVIEQPILVTRGPVEAFVCQPETYFWLLDHHDRGAAAWKRLGAQCLDITDRGGGRFGWADELGSDVHWDAVLTTPQVRVWYAEGRIKPGSLLPMVPVRAVLVLRHAQGQDGGDTVIRHQADLFLHSDSKAAAVVTRLLGNSAPRLAEQYIGQVEMFFSALAAYLKQHPERAPALLAETPEAPRRSTAPPKASVRKPGAEPD